MWLRRIAARFGRLDVDELADELTEDEFSKWVALGVIDDWSGEWHAAKICQTIWNALLDLQRRGGMVFGQPENKEYKTESDFMMTFTFEKPSAPKKKPLTSNQQAELFKKMAGL